MFKKGDKLRCVDSSGWSKMMSVGDILEPLADEVESRVTVINGYDILYGLSANRFELVEDSNMIKVGDMVESLINQCDITEGSKYEVVGVFSTYVVIADDAGDHQNLRNSDIKKAGPDIIFWVKRLGSSVHFSNNKFYGVFFLEGLLKVINDEGEVLSFYCENYSMGTACETNPDTEKNIKIKARIETIEKELEELKGELCD